MAMLHAFLTMAPAFPLYVAHIHHGLRPESDEEAAMVEQYCGAHSVPCYVFRTNVTTERQKGETVESAARRLRYAFFKSLAAQVGATHIATAHTADDQCETVLLHLIHGAGLKGLGGILPQREEDGFLLIRPLLDWSKEEILSYCNTHSVPYCTDKSNQDLSYTRNRIRHILIPEMEQINPNLRKTLCRTAVLLQKQQRDLTDKAQTFLSAHPEEIPLKELQTLSEAEQGEVLRLWLESAGKSLSFEQTGQGLALLSKETGTVEFDRKYRLHLGQGFLSLSLKEDPLPEVTVTAEETVLPDGRTLTFHKVTATEHNRYRLIPAKLPLTLRPRREKDTIGTAGGTKTLKKRLIELKIPQYKRDRLWVLTDGARVFWCERAGTNRKIAPNPGEEGYFITLSEQ